MGSDIILRDFKPEDFNGLMQLWEATDLGNVRRGDNLEIILHSIELGGKLIVLEHIETQEIIGSSWMTFDGRRIHLHHIGVLPDFQNQGFGKLLTRESLLFAKKKGYQIKLEVNINNENAIHLYKNLGFKRLGDYDIYIVRNLDEIRD